MHVWIHGHSISLAGLKQSGDNEILMIQQMTTATEAHFRRSLSYVYVWNGNS